MQARGGKGFADHLLMELLPQGSINGRQRPSCRYERQSSIASLGGCNRGKIKTKPLYLFYVSRHVLGPMEGGLWGKFI